MRHTWPALLGALALSLSAVGCGDKEDDDESSDDGGGEGGGVGGEGSGEGEGSGTDGAVGGCVDTVVGTAVGEAVASGTTSGATDDFDTCGGGDDGWSDEGSDDSPEVDGSSSDEGGGGEPPPDSGDIDWPDSGGGWDSSAPDHTVQWTAPADGWYTFYTLGSSFDTKLEVREASCEGDVLDCDDDGGRNLDSLIQLEVSAGTTYLLTVDGYDGGEYGPYVLNIAEGRISVGGDDSGWSDEGSDGWDSGTSVEPDPDPDSEAGSWAWPGLIAAWLTLMGLGGALTGRREQDGA
jgi:hypothetical protein